MLKSKCKNTNGKTNTLPEKKGNHLNLCEWLGLAFSWEGYPNPTTVAPKECKRLRINENYDGLCLDRRKTFQTNLRTLSFFAWTYRYPKPFPQKKASVVVFWLVLKSTNAWPTTQCYSCAPPLGDTNALRRVNRLLLYFYPSSRGKSLGHAYNINMFKPA